MRRRGFFQGLFGGALAGGLSFGSRAEARAGKKTLPAAETVRAAQPQWEELVWECPPEAGQVVHIPADYIPGSLTIYLNGLLLQVGEDKDCIILPLKKGEKTAKVVFSFKLMPRDQAVFRYQTWRDA